MPTEALRLGPFIGGLNTSSDASSIADEELVDLVNMDLDIDTGLVSRPPFQDFTNDAAWTERIVILGVGVFSSGNYIIGSNANGVFQFSSGAWSEITVSTNRFEATAMVQYADKVWLVPKPGSTNSGGNWDPTNGFTADADVPQGEAIVVFKERLWITPGKDSTTDTSRLKFSEPGDPGNWPSANFIDISQGDGEKLIDLVQYRGNLLLFKENSTYVLSYDTAPVDATLDVISITIGTTTRRCLATYENVVYVYHIGDVYELVNYDFQRINIKVPFEFDGTAPDTRVEEVFLSVVGDRLIIRYFNRIYVYGFLTQTWSRWESASTDLHNFGPLVKFPANQAQDIPDEYYAGSSITSNIKVYRFKDGYDATVDESVAGTPFDINCVVLTKNFDLAASYLYKKMNWWGADVITSNDVTGTVTPIVFGFDTTWGALFNQERTWDSLGPWDNPTTEISPVTTVVSAGIGSRKRFIKFPKALRFRQINFKIEMTTNGTLANGPVRLFIMVLVAQVKQTVTRAVS